MRLIFEHIPYMESYGNPIYFVYLLLALLPIVIGIFKQKRFALYETLVSFLFILFMFGGDNYHQLIAFTSYLIWQIAIVFAYQNYRKHKNQTAIFYSSILVTFFASYFSQNSTFYF